MATEQNYKRDPNGSRFEMGGMNTVLPPDALPPGKYCYLQNVRRYLLGRMTGRATQASASITLGAAVHSLRRLNDSTAAYSGFTPPTDGYSLIGGAAGDLYCNATAVATGLSGNSLALVPFRPNSSPQPWMYVGDSSDAASIGGFSCAGMLKVRSDGLTYKMGVKEPQTAPVVGSGSYTTSGSFTLQATTLPWQSNPNTGGLNPTFSYGQTSATDGTLPSAIPTHNIPGSTLTITSVTGTATINGATHAPGDAGPTGSTNPGHYVSSAYMVLGAWTDASGEIITVSGSQTVNIGGGAVLTVPVGAYQLVLGVNGTANSFSANSGQFTVNFTLTVTALSTAITTVGDITTYYWGDSPHSGPVTHYIWRSASDSSGSGPIRDISTAAGSLTGNSLIFDAPTTGDGTTPMAWTVLDGTGAVVGTKSVFEPALESEGYQDFNLCVVGNIYVPAAGVYSFHIASTNETMWGIGGNATWSTSGLATSYAGQTKTVVNGLPLLPCAIGGGNITVAVYFPGAAIYPIELNYDYWDKSGRTLEVQAGGVTIAPVAATVKEGVQYRYVFRSSVTGATSNPSPESPPLTIPSLANTVTAGETSTDPQVDKVDFYRMDAAVTNFTFVGTVDNTVPPTLYSDQLLDADIAGNALLQFDNYEPFPSIDLPRRGMVTVSGGATVTWQSGDQFNLRWLPGTIINIGGIDYTFYNRPQSATELTVIDGADSGVPQVYEITEPILAAQPTPSMWGNSDNAAYMFAIDPLNPGDLLFCKGNNLDSAPDTNRINVTSPSEILVNGVMANGIGMVFSTENGWIIYPNFTSATATILGTVGTVFSLIRSGVTRGLYIRPAICADGSGAYFYRSKDGIEMSVAGGKQQSVTDQDLYNLFPHEGFLPSPITLGGYTVYPPDDTQPELQKLRFATGYLYYDYVDTTNVPRTLVYDVAGGGWVVDVYQYPATVHMLEEGPGVNGVLTGCSDGSVRALVNGGGETATCVCLTPAVNGGDARANKTVGDVFVRASVAGSAVAVAPYANQFVTALAGFSPSTLAVGSGLQPYILDFSNGMARDVSDIELALSWLAGTATYLDLWQPDWTSLPESTQDRPTDWTDGGAQGAMLVQGLVLEADTFGAAKSIQIQSADDLSLHTPDQGAVTFNGQSKQSLSFGTPFVADSVRIISTDGVPWRYFGAVWVTTPYANDVENWMSDFQPAGSTGANLVQGVTLEAETFGQSKIIQFVSGDDGSVHTPVESPITLPRHDKITLSFDPPFVAYNVALMTEDGVPWRYWGHVFLSTPYAPLVDTWKTDFQPAGSASANLVQGVILEADTFGQNKIIQFISGDDGSMHTPVESPINLANHDKIALSFDPPFVAYNVALVAEADDVPWCYWGHVFLSTPYAPLVDTWKTDFQPAGSNGPNFIQGLILEADTGNRPKKISVISGDDGSVHVPNESPVVFNGHSKQALTFTPPFIAFSAALVAEGDAVPWRYWGHEWVAKPFPPLVVEWQTEVTSLGNAGWQHLREMNIAHVSAFDLQLTLVFDPGAVPASISLTVPNSGGLQAKTKVTVPPNKFKLVSFRLSCNSTQEKIASYVNATATIWFPLSRPLGNSVNGVMWSNFALPYALPADAVIEGIYPVIRASGTYQGVFQWLVYGTGLAFETYGPTGGAAFTLPVVSTNPATNTTPIIPGLTFAATEFYGPSIGATLSALAGQEILVGLYQSLFLNNLADQIQITGLGYAVYYTSATPQYDPELPPPFAIPPGQGMAWAIPSAVTTTQPGNQGVVQILATELGGGTATYTYSLSFGPTPAVGQQISVQNTTNAGGAMNGLNMTITAASGNTFSVAVGGSAAYAVEGASAVALTSTSGGSNTGAAVGTVASATMGFTQSPFRVFEKDCECKVGMWGRQESYRNLKVIGGNSDGGASV